jgi:hypothetical protein
MTFFAKTSCVLLALPCAALAYSTGIVGYSGQQQKYCTDCHGGGALPTVKLAGPTALDAGDTGDYTLTITGGAAVVGGTDISVDNAAAQLVAGTGTSVFGGEITHNLPAPFTANTLVFPFQVVAMPSAGTVTIYGAGNSCNGDQHTSGDNSALDQLTVTVTGSILPDGGNAIDTPAVDPNGAPPVLGPVAGCEVGLGPCGVGMAALLLALLRRTTTLQG